MVLMNYYFGSEDALGTVHEGFDPDGAFLFSFFKSCKPRSRTVVGCWNEIGSGVEISK